LALNLALCRFQSVEAPREQADPGSMPSKLLCGRSPEACGCAGNDDRFRLHNNSF